MGETGGGNAFAKKLTPLFSCTTVFNHNNTLPCQYLSRYLIADVVGVLNK